MKTLEKTCFALIEGMGFTGGILKKEMLLADGTSTYWVSAGDMTSKKHPTPEASLEELVRLLTKRVDAKVKTLETQIAKLRSITAPTGAAGPHGGGTCPGCAAGAGDECTCSIRTPAYKVGDRVRLARKTRGTNLEHRFIGLTGTVTSTTPNAYEELEFMVSFDGGAKAGWYIAGDLDPASACVAACERTPEPGSLTGFKIGDRVKVARGRYQHIDETGTVIGPCGPHEVCVGFSSSRGTGTSAYTGYYMTEHLDHVEEEELARGPWGRGSIKKGDIVRADRGWVSTTEKGEVVDVGPTTCLVLFPSQPEPVALPHGDLRRTTCGADNE